MNTSSYLDKNRDSWDQRTDVHVGSDFYDNEAVRSGKSSLKEIEIPLLGYLMGLKVLHLQCHFGQDSISLARMGASVTGIDFSDNAIRYAKQLAVDTKADAGFICSDIYSLPENHTGLYDVVFTSYGTIGWLPDLEKWANVISKFLKPGGRFVFVEFHPVMWMFDYDFTKVDFDYFNTGPIEEKIKGTYADTNAEIETETVTWNHSLGEVFTALLNNGLMIESFKEYDYSPYNCFKHAVEYQPGRFRVGHIDKLIPLTYSITAIKQQLH